MMKQWIKETKEETYDWCASLQTIRNKTEDEPRKRMWEEGASKGTKLMVHGIPEGTALNEINLEDHFEAHGRVTIFSKSERVTGDASIVFATRDDLQRALKKGVPTKFESVVLEVDEEKPRLAKNPKNVENLRSWAHAMIDLSDYTTDENKIKKLYTEAIAKLEDAYEINYEDKKLRLELLFARLEFGGDGEKEDDTLVTEYITLYEVLNPDLNEENTSSWTLKTCQKNKEAVSSEDYEKTEVGFDPDEYEDLYEELNRKLNDSESVKRKDPSRVSKTLFVANLPYSIEQADIENFFKDAGKVVEIRLSLNAKGDLKGYGDVELDTVEAVHKPFCCECSNSVAAVAKD